MTTSPAHGGPTYAGSLVLIFLLGALLYAQVLTGPFLYDDVTEILANPRVHRSSAIPGLIFEEFWTGVPGWPSLHRPVTAATIPILFVLGGGASWPFHLANAILHGLVSCLLAAIVMHLSGHRVAAVVAGVLFAAHPIHTEAVAWISGRSELLFAASGAVAWWLHLRARESGRIIHVSAAALLLGLSFGSKETALCWPAIFIAGDLLFPPPGATRTKLLRLHAVPLAVTAAWLCWRLGVLGHLGRRPSEGIALSNPLVEVPWWPASFFTSLRLALIAAVKGIWPGAACIDYGYDQIPIAQGPLHGDIAIAMAGLAALVWWGWRIARLREQAGSAGRSLLLGAAVGLLAWIPASSAVVPSIVIFAERNLYLPVFGWCLAAGVLAETLWNRYPARRGLLAGTGVALLAVAAGFTLVRAELYRDSLALFAASAESCERSANAQVLHAAALEEAGRDQEAAAALRRALAIAPDHADARVALAGVLVRTGRSDEAAIEVHRALESRELAIETRLAAVDVLHASKEPGAADELLAALVAENPDDLRVMFTRGRTLLGLGRTAEALGVFNALTLKHPRSPYGPDGEGAALMALHRLDEAERSFRRALEIDPYDTNALYNLGMMLSRSGEAPRVMEAARLLARYLRVMPNDATVWEQLALARETVGDAGGARQARQRAERSRRR